MADAIRMNENTWRIEDSGVRFFLLEGNETALLIDTGKNTPDARKIAETITTLPLRLLNTHADPDHTAGNAAFDEFYMSTYEGENYRGHGGAGKIIPVSEGDVIDLGGRRLEVLDLPGHTPGSIAVLDVSARVLFGGDSIQDGNIFMFGARRNMELYIRTLRELWEKHGEEFDRVYPSHGSIPVDKGIIPELILGAENIAAGKLAGTAAEFMGKVIVRYDVGAAGFLCDK